MTAAPVVDELDSFEAAFLDARTWSPGPCLLCGDSDMPVTPVVAVYQGGTAHPVGKCRACLVTGLLVQRATAEALHRPYTPSLPLPPIKELPPS